MTLRGKITLLPVFSAFLLFLYDKINQSDHERYHFKDPCLNESYDFIIVGAGSAGSVVANRLAENCDWTILLVEAGGEENLISETPLLAASLWNTDKDWNYTTVKQDNACYEFDGFCQYPRGHVLGGSSAINFMFYVRGNKIDYDNWECQGNKGWGYKNVWPYFLKSENMSIPALQDSPYHSCDGYLSVEGLRYCSPLVDCFMAAARKVWGLHDNIDYNGEYQIGYSCPQLTMSDGSRCSTSRAFLAPIRNKKNIHIVKRTFVECIYLSENNDLVTGVKLNKNRKIINIVAKKEVILSAGAINTPKILMLSGIGPKQHLCDIGVIPKVDLPVGENLVDHSVVSAYFKINRNVTITKCKISSAEEVEQYYKHKTGSLASSFGVSSIAHYYLNGNDPTVPDIQFYFCDFFSYENNEPIIQILFAKLRPKSIGSVRLRSSDPFEMPLIDPKFFCKDEDYRDSVKACMVVLDMIKSDIFCQFEPRLYSPNDFCKDLDGEEYCRCVIKYYSKTMYHPTGTARMACNLRDGVVTSALKVWGISNLRVIDASVMPNITSGNTNAPTIMIAEKGADYIKKQWSCD